MKNLENIINSLWKWFASVKLTVGLFILIAIFSAIGTFIQQNADPSLYLKIYGELGTRIIFFLKLNDIYSSAPFQFLLSLLIINLTVCSFERFFPLWKTLKRVNLLNEPSRIKSSTFYSELTLEEKYNPVRLLEETLIERNYTVFINREEERITIGAEKGKFSRFGPYITHFGVILIVIGAIIGRGFGQRGYVEILEGNTVNYFHETGTRRKIALPFKIHCENFRIEFYDSKEMMPKDYFSKLVIIDGEEMVLRKTIEVNDPLEYKGYTFYQANYRPAEYTVNVLFLLEFENGTTSFITAEYEEEFELTEGIKAKLVDFADNYMGLGPVAILEIIPDHAEKRRFPVFSTTSFPHGNIKGIKGIRVKDFNLKILRYYTGLQVKKDPGVPVVLVGFVIMSVGVIISLAFSHKRIWAMAVKEGNSWKISLGGWVYKNKNAFEKHFLNLTENLKSKVKAQG